MWLPTKRRRGGVGESAANKIIAASQWYLVVWFWQAAAGSSAPLPAQATPARGQTRGPTATRSVRERDVRSSSTVPWPAWYHLRRVTSAVIFDSCVAFVLVQRIRGATVSLQCNFRYNDVEQCNGTVQSEIRKVIVFDEHGLHIYSACQ
jgi:hypothetical protein